jgi:hypothetical protein
VRAQAVPIHFEAELLNSNFLTALQVEAIAVKHSLLVVFVSEGDRNGEVLHPFPVPG